MNATTLTPEVAAQFMRMALGHVTREYPNKLDHVLSGPDDLGAPHFLHPIFYGSFDWHSCVHAYWLVARLSGRYPDLPESSHARALFATTFTSRKIAVELAYLARPTARGFERPYGWAWVLLLSAELHTQRDKGAAVSADALKPLADAFAERFRGYLPKATYPVRSGVHSSTAFALALGIEYARICDDAPLAQMVIDAARRWYLDDVDCQAWEPSNEDFLSPCLMEAECLRRLLPSAEFDAWFARFLPRLAQREPRTLFQPATVSDRSDGRIAHLDGLNLSRAWCFANLAATLPTTDPRHAVMQQAALHHREASLRHIGEHYMGEHWLATFALLALEAAS